LSTFDIIKHAGDGHFDTYQMFIRAIEIGSISYGYGFLGTLFFFVPRSIWDSKPITSGIAISQMAELRLENVSMPIIAEFYLNFWYVGIIIGPIFIALLMKVIDEAYSNIEERYLSLFHLIYFQLVGLIIYIMRGGLLSSFAYTVSILMTWVLIYFLVNTSVSFSNKQRP
jgi:hypothetical protein